MDEKKYLQKNHKFSILKDLSSLKNKFSSMDILQQACVSMNISASDS